MTKFLTRKKRGLRGHVILFFCVTRDVEAIEHGTKDCDRPTRTTLVSCDSDAYIFALTSVSFRDLPLLYDIIEVLV